MSTPSTEPAPGERTLSLAGASFVGIGAIVGGGIFVLGGPALAVAGSGAVWAYVFNGVIALITALSFAELSTTFPVSGGAYVYSRQVLSVRAAFLTGWVLWFAHVVTGLLYAVGFATYAVAALSAVTGPETAEWLHRREVYLAIAAGSALLFTLLFTTRPSGGGSLGNIIKLLLFGIIILWGLYTWAAGAGPERNDSPALELTGNWIGVISAMGMTFITLQGFDLIGAVGGEIRSPGRNIPLAMILSLGCALAVYIPLLLIVLAIGIPPGETVREWASANPGTCIADAVEQFAGRTGYWLVTGAALFATLTALGANLLAASHVAAAMATDRTLPRYLSQRHQRYQTPHVALFGGWITIIVLLLLLPDLTAVGAASSLVFLIAFSLTHGTAMLARRRGAGTAETFRMPWFPILPLFGGLACLALAIYQGVTVPSAGSVVGVWLMIGIAIYLFSLAPRAEALDAYQEARNPELMRLRGRSPSVVIPISNPGTVRTLAELGESVTSEGGRITFLHILSAGELALEKRLPAIAKVVSRLSQVEQRRIRSPELLVTTSESPWGEIRRLGRELQCETMILGLSRLDQQLNQGPLPTLLNDLDCHVLLCTAVDDWTPGEAKRILIPLEGQSAHDRIRARLLGSLVRKGAEDLHFMRVIPPGDTRSRREAERALRRHAQDEGRGAAHHSVVESDSPAAAIVEMTRESDLLVLGVSRIGRTLTFGPILREILQDAECPIVLIAHAP
jgi:amino acid transporter